MKIQLPFIGKDTEKQTSATIVNVPTRKKALDTLGGVLSFTKSALSNERTISSKLLKANKEWVYRNNDVIAQEVANIEFELYSVDIKGGEVVFNTIDEHPLLDLLDKLNSRSTKFDGFYMTQSHKKLTGDAFWLLTKNGSVVDSVYILPPDKVELILTDPTVGGDLIEAYRYVDVIDGKQIDKTYDPKDIIHFKKPNPQNAFRGYGAVEAIADTIDTDNLTNEVQRQFFEKGAISNFVLTSEANITQEQLKRLKAEMRSMYSGARNAYNTMIFGNGLKPSDIGFSNKDMEFLNLLEWYRDKIMIGFGNTKASLGIIDDVNRASFEGSLAGWLRGTVKPDMASITQTLNEFLVPLFGENLILGFKDPVPQNIKENTDRAVRLKEAGVITKNEAREIVGMDAVEGGDTFEGEAETPPTDQSEAKKLRLERSKIPASVKNIDYKRVLRKNKIYFRVKQNKELKNRALPIIKEFLKPAKPEVPAQSKQLTDEAIQKYYQKQMNTVDLYQEEFNKKLLRILANIKDEAVNNVDTQAKTIKGLARFIKNKELFNEEAVVVQAQIDLTPILMGAVVASGQEAYRLINLDVAYIPYKISDSIRAAVENFAVSMVNTDKEKLAKIIQDGIENGSTITEIRNLIQEQFSDYTKIQAERITRTEVLRASSMATEDAFIQSGIVEAKQWLVAPGADAKCAQYADMIVKLGSDFYTPDDSGFQDGNPPIHVNCRCVLIPVVEGTEPTKASAKNNAKSMKALQDKIAELEAKMDKRTKKYKQERKKYEAQTINDTIYIKTLEKHLGVSNED